MDAIDGAPTILHVWVFARLGEGVNWYSGACPTGRGPEWRLRAKHRAASVTVLLQGLWQPTGTFQPPEPPFHSGRPDIAPKEVMARLGSAFGGFGLEEDRVQIQRRAAELRGARA